MASSAIKKRGGIGRKDINAVSINQNRARNDNDCGRTRRTHCWFVVVFMLSAPDLYGIPITLGPVPSRIYMPLVASSFEAIKVVFRLLT
jgi:hypothetical protein